MKKPHIVHKKKAKSEEELKAAITEEITKDETTSEKKEGDDTQAPEEEQMFEFPKEHHHYHYPRPEITYQHSVVHENQYTVIQVSGMNDTSTMENFLKVLSVHTGKPVDALIDGIMKPEPKKADNSEKQTYVG